MHFAFLYFAQRSNWQFLCEREPIFKGIWINNTICILRRKRLKRFQNLSAKQNNITRHLINKQHEIELTFTNICLSWQKMSSCNQQLKSKLHPTVFCINLWICNYNDDSFEFFNWYQFSFNFFSISSASEIKNCNVSIQSLWINNFLIC